MSAYDSPGFREQLPGMTGGYGTWQTAPGSQAAGVPTATTSYDTGGTSMSSALVTPPGGSLVNADRVPVGPLDTLVGLQADQYNGSDVNVLSGGIPGSAFGSTSAGQGSVSSPHHPNAGTGT